MKLGKNQSSENVFLEEEECSYAHASLSLNLSSTDMDESTNSFYATIDRMVFKKPVEVISAVLEGNGYVVNLENILSCLDQFSIGVKGHSRSSSNEDQVQLKTYLPCLSFKMPAKSRQGTLLKKFYQEIEGYEAELARVQGVIAEKKKTDKLQSKAELRDEIKELQNQNQNLNRQVEIMSKSLETAERSSQYAESQLQSGNFLPDNMRAAIVRGVFPNERSVTLKTGRKTFHLSMSTLSSIPEVGETCLVHIQDGKAGKAFFYEKPGFSFAKTLATVLNVDGHSVKFRDRKRNTFVITAINKDEEDAIAKLKRGHDVILNSYQNYLVSFSVCTQADARDFQDHVQEEIARGQIEAAMVEGTTHVQERFDDKDEVA